MKKLFGTDGVRAKAGVFPLDGPTIQTIARSLARQYGRSLGRKPRFITGRDTRESGPAIESAFHAGAMAEGAVCESAGVITTPGVAYLTRAFEFDAGIVISASHNPYEDNGIKIFKPDGRKIGEETERVIERDVYALRSDEDVASVASVDDRRADAFQASYLDHLAEIFSGLRLGGVSIVADCANGAASYIAPALLRRLEATVIAINDQPDGHNINADCGSLHLDRLQKAVVEKRADFGVAFDGDADRALFVDELGNIVDGDATLWIMARSLLAGGGLVNRTVVATLMSNIGLELALSGIGVTLVRTAVGDKYVLDELIKSGSELGGEQSGHVIFPRQSLVGDGLMTTLFVLQAVTAGDRPFSAATEGFTRYPQILVNVRVKEKRPFEGVAEIAAAGRRIEDELAGKGRLLLRYSGTENLARVMIEGKDQAEIERQANALAHVIERNLG